jgi:hypothetical protein
MQFNFSLQGWQLVEEMLNLSDSYLRPKPQQWLNDKEVL